MKAIICGGRNYVGDPDIDFVHLDNLRMAHNIDEVVSGGAKGADRIGERWAQSRKLQLSVFKAEWRKNGVYNRGAGLLRNKQMLTYILYVKNDGIVIAFPGGTGTNHMMAIARNANIPVIEISRLIQADSRLRNTN